MSEPEPNPEKEKEKETENEKETEATPEETAENEIKEITSAGILPFAIVKRNVFFLLGKEVYDPKYGDSDKWGDFSGKIEKDENVIEGAAREFYEETAGVIMDIAEAKQKLNEEKYTLYTDMHPKTHSSFRSYLLLVPYKDYPAMFRNTKQFIQYVGGNIKVIEKSKLQWFSLQEITDTLFHRWTEDRYLRKPKFRAKFAEMMRRIATDVNLQQRCIQAYLTCDRHYSNERYHYYHKNDSG
jgi:8-oxo-dGTP pyrophosphatase MutT (NUDIX family)